MIGDAVGANHDPVAGLEHAVVQSRLHDGLAADPVVLLMDEPFSAVDPIVRGRLQEEFLRLQQSVRKTVVIVTHDMKVAESCSRTVALRDGRVVEDVVRAHV